MLSLIAAGAAGDVVAQLGYKTLEGEQVGYFVFVDGSQSNLSGFPDTSEPGVV